MTSTKPYFIRALYEWCTDNGFSPYMAVRVDQSVQVPLEYVNNGEIVLNIGFDATSGLDLGNDFVRFQARFAGVVREIIVPVSHVMAIYAKENGQGMTFPMPATAEFEAENAMLQESDSLVDVDSSPPSLHLVEGHEQAQEHENTLTSDDDDEPPTSPRGKGGKSKKPTLKLVK